MDSVPPHLLHRQPVGLSERNVVVMICRNSLSRSKNEGGLLPGLSLRFIDCLYRVRSDTRRWSSRTAVGLKELLAAGFDAGHAARRTSIARRFRGRWIVAGAGSRRGFRGNLRGGSRPGLVRCRRRGRRGGGDRPGGRRRGLSHQRMAVGCRMEQASGDWSGQSGANGQGYHKVSLSHLFTSLSGLSFGLKSYSLAESLSERRWRNSRNLSPSSRDRRAVGGTD